MRVTIYEGCILYIKRNLLGIQKRCVATVNYDLKNEKLVSFHQTIIPITLFLCKRISLSEI